MFRRVNRSKNLQTMEILTEQGTEEVHFSITHQRKYCIYKYLAN